MQEIYNLIAKVADTDSTILIQGESGTGKELVARALHFNSTRQHQPFVAINCSALPENLLESELFGHKKGAFTGAVQDKAGLFEEAQSGTIFLDEINSMAQPLQTKLLRVLQERVIRRVGDTKNIPINVRVLAATNEPLLEKTKSGSFREDLYYRLAVIPIEMPSLRERPEDIPLLVQHFMHKNAQQLGGEPKKIDAKVIEVLQGYNWPGNVRELENAIERACALCDEGLVRVDDLPPHVLRHSGAQADGAESLPVGQKLDDYIHEQESRYIEQTIKVCKGSREKAAKMLGISMATLYRKIEPKGGRAAKKK
jgi:transcriptional regulator with PAS, ATPase and Fis domain